jgi:cell pole-organizing protein PopZ
VAAQLGSEPGPALGAAGRTLEEIVRDALHPLLRAWLDAHLPDIVERLVQEEIHRLVRAARPR